MARAAARPPASARDRTSTRSASSPGRIVSAAASALIVVATANSVALPKAKSPMPSTRQATAGKAEGRCGAEMRMVSVAPGAMARASARCRPTISGQASAEGVAASGRSLPFSSVHALRTDERVLPIMDTLVVSPVAPVSTACSMRTSVTSSTSGSRRKSEASRPASPIGARRTGNPSWATTRTSKPLLFSRSANDSTRPRDSSSMSKSSAPMMATPAMASRLRIR